MGEGQNPFRRGLIMESVPTSLKPVSIVERLSATRFLITVPEEQQIDSWALLRWADDGGRWVEDRDQAIAGDVPLSQRAYQSNI